MVLSAFPTQKKQIVSVFISTRLKYFNSTNLFSVSLVFLYRPSLSTFFNYRNSNL